MANVNPRVPTDERVSHVSGLAFLSIPRFINRIGLTAAEIGIYVNQYLCSNDDHDFEDEKGNTVKLGNVVWKGYKRNKRDLKVGNDKLSLTNQLFENSGLWRISRPNTRMQNGKKLIYRGRDGEKIEVTSNVYEFLVFDAKRNKELIPLFFEIVAEEREKLLQFYKQNRGKMRKRGGKRA